MDPLSITTAVASLITLADKKLKSLLSEVECFKLLLEQMAITMKDINVDAGVQETGHLGNHLRSISVCITDGIALLEQMHQTVRSVGKTSRLLDGVRKHFRLQSASDEISMYHDQIRSYRDTIQLSMQTMILGADELRHLHNRRDCMRAAAEVVSSASTVFGLDDRISTSAPSDFNEVFPPNPSEPMLRWFGEVEPSEYEEPDVALEPARWGTLNVLTAPGLAHGFDASSVVLSTHNVEDSDSDGEMEAEIVQLQLEKGRLELQSGNFEGAEKMLRNGLIRLNRYRSRHFSPELKLSVSHALLNTYSQQGNWEKAKEVTTERLAILSGHNFENSDQYLDEILSLADILLRMGDSVQARVYTRKCLKAYREQGDRGREGLEQSLCLMIAICQSENNPEDEEAFKLLLTHSMAQNSRPENRTVVLPTLNDDGELSFQPVDTSPQVNIPRDSLDQQAFADPYALDDLLCQPDHHNSSNAGHTADTLGPGAELSTPSLGTNDSRIELGSSALQTLPDTQGRPPFLPNAISVTQEAQTKSTEFTYSPRVCEQGEDATIECDLTVPTVSDEDKESHLAAENDRSDGSNQSPCPERSTSTLESFSNAWQNDFEQHSTCSSEAEEDVICVGPLWQRQLPSGFESPQRNTVSPADAHAETLPVDFEIYVSSDMSHTVSGAQSHADSPSQDTATTTQRELESYQTQRVDMPNDPPDIIVFSDMNQAEITRSSCSDSVKSTRLSSASDSREIESSANSTADDHWSQGRSDCDLPRADSPSTSMTTLNSATYSNLRERITVLVVGESCCGKTSLIWKFIQKTGSSTKPQITSFTVPYPASVDVASNGEEQLELIIWDTPGLEAKQSFESIATVQNVQCVLLCYSVGDPDLAANIEDIWIHKLKKCLPGTPIILVALQTDLRDDARVLKELGGRKDHPCSFAEGERFKDRLGVAKYRECSAWTAEGVDEVFRQAAIEGLRHKVSKQKGRTSKISGAFGKFLR
ncbi:hypothetical protein J7T55_011124 [Diaporthe amygdali]|uniref:uncharacterized protein n=1 Tax=Phomopsis amygdali TaxID=1214568 RepID=UPI0022FEE7C5|nr:uncharacterized protein J7T55_011124 [Diaporthe amygdali]KAJ0104340.1 hypothetical protein J7T55_011124 [Diaporthe amygdali]